MENTYFKNLDIKHVSFDAWNTILIPNPNFAEQRTNAIANRVLGSKEFIQKVFTHVKAGLNECAERGGQSTTIYENWKAFLRKFPVAMLTSSQSNNFGINGLNRSQYTDIVSYHTANLAYEIQNLFLRFPPHIPENTIKGIKLLKSRGITVSISSNTNFISGQTINEVFEKAGLDFDFLLFSDLQASRNFNTSKPHPLFFSEVFENANIMHNNTLNRENVLHIGDDSICDFEGAKKFGFQAFQVESAIHLAEVIDKLV